MRDVMKSKNSDSQLLSATFEFLQPFFFCIPPYPQYFGFVDKDVVTKPHPPFPGTKLSVHHAAHTNIITTTDARSTILTLPSLPLSKDSKNSLQSFYVEITVKEVNESGIVYFGVIPRRILSLNSYSNERAKWLQECTFAESGHQFITQPFFQCYTCWPTTSGVGCCTRCVEVCHIGHDVEVSETTLVRSCYCDCGAGDAPSPCKLYPCSLVQGIKCTSTPAIHKSDISFNVNQPVGAFCDLQKQRYILTKNNHVIGDFVPMETSDMVPILVLYGSVQVEYNLGPHQKNDLKEFPLEAFCEGFRLPFPKCPSLKLSILSQQKW